MVRANLAGIVFEGAFPDHLSDEILFSENLVTYLFQIGYLVVVDTYEDCAILLQQVLAEIESWEHHIQPARVEAARRVRIRGKLSAFAVLLAGVFQIGLKGLGELIG